MRYPVSPLLCPYIKPRDEDHHVELGDDVHGLDDVVRESGIVPGDPIVGRHPGDDARPRVRVLQSPKEMSAE